MDRKQIGRQASKQTKQNTNTNNWQQGNIQQKAKTNRKRKNKKK